MYHIIWGTTDSMGTLTKRKGPSWPCLTVQFFTSYFISPLEIYGYDGWDPIRKPSMELFLAVGFQNSSRLTTFGGRSRPGYFMDWSTGYLCTHFFDDLSPELIFSTYPFSPWLLSLASPIRNMNVILTCMGHHRYNDKEILLPAENIVYIIG